MNTTAPHSSTASVTLARKAPARFRRAVGLLTAAFAGMLAVGLTGSAAFASIPAPRGAAAGPATQAVAPTIKVISAGVATWQVALIAAGAALLGAAVAVLATQLRPGRRMASSATA